MKSFNKIITLLFLITSSTVVFGQTNYEKFQKLFKSNDTIKVKRLLTEWKKANPNDPELYTSAINFYFSNSKQEILSIDKEQKSDETFRLTDSSGKVAGYINSNLDYNSSKLSKAINYANSGIEKFPNRLDIRFGKCYILGQIGDYENFTTEIIRTVEYSLINKNNWLWTENKKKEDAEESMLGTIQSYLTQLYETEDDKLLSNMIKIGETTLKYYHSNVEILSTTSVALLLTKNYDKAIGYLKEAEKLNPKDFIVLNNIAQGYKLKGDKVNAIKYYELTKKFGDDKAKKQALQNIKELKK